MRGIRLSRCREFGKAGSRTGTPDLVTVRAFLPVLDEATKHFIQHNNNAKQMAARMMLHCKPR